MTHRTGCRAPPFGRLGNQERTDSMVNLEAGTSDPGGDDRPKVLEAGRSLAAAAFGDGRQHGHEGWMHIAPLAALDGNGGGEDAPRTGSSVAADGEGGGEPPHTKRMGRREHRWDHCRARPPAASARAPPWESTHIGDGPKHLLHRLLVSSSAAAQSHAADLSACRRRGNAHGRRPLVPEKCTRDRRRRRRHGPRSAIVDGAGTCDAERLHPLNRQCSHHPIPAPACARWKSAT